MLRNGVLISEVKTANNELFQHCAIAENKKMVTYKVSL